MEFALVLRELWNHKLGLAVGLIVAIAAATLSVENIAGFGLKAKPLQYSAASTQVLIDSPSTILGNLDPASVQLTTVATLDANFMTSPAVLDVIAKQVGLSGDQLAAQGPVSTLPRADVEPTAVERNVELTGESTPYRLDYSNNPNLPIVGIDSQAPTTKMAVALANAAAAGLGQYINKLQDSDNVPVSHRVVIRQLGPATGSVVNAGISKKLAGLVFFAVMFIWSILILAGSRFRRTWRDSRHLHAARTGVHDPRFLDDDALIDERVGVSFTASSNGIAGPGHAMSENGHEVKEGSDSAHRPLFGRPWQARARAVRAHDD